MALRAREFERILQQVDDRAHKELAVDRHVDAWGDPFDRECQTARGGLHGGSDLDFFDELSDRDSLRSASAGVEAYLSDRGVDESARSPQAAVDDGRGTATDPYAPHLERLERQHRRAEGVAKLVGEVPQALGPGVDDRLLAGARVLADRLRDGLIEASVERVELGRADWRLRLARQVGDNLADPSIIMDDLGDREAPIEEIATMPRSALGHRFGRRLGEAQRVDELVQEKGDALLELLFGGARRRPEGHLRARAFDNRSPVREEEFVKHPGLNLPRRAGRGGGRPKARVSRMRRARRPWRPHEGLAPGPSLFGHKAS